MPRGEKASLTTNYQGKDKIWHQTALCIMHKEAVPDPRLGFRANLTILAILISLRHQMFAVVIALNALASSRAMSASLISQRYSMMAADSARTSGSARSGLSIVITGLFPSGWTFFNSGGASLSLPRLYVLSSYGTYKHELPIATPI
jgi:hypothetical protein